MPTKGGRPCTEKRAKRVFHWVQGDALPGLEGAAPLHITNKNNSKGDYKNDHSESDLWRKGKQTFIRTVGDGECTAR